MIYSDLVYPDQQQRKLKREKMKLLTGFKSVKHKPVKSVIIKADMNS